MTVVSPFFNGDFQTGNLSQYELFQGPPAESSPPKTGTRIAIVEDAPAGTGLKYACEFSYVSGDPLIAGSQRSELQRPNPYAYPGEHVYIDEWIKVVEYDQTHYHLLRQFHEIEEPTGVAFGLYLEGEGASAELKLKAGTGASWWTHPFPGLNKWFHIKVHIYFSDTAGIVEAWFCGEGEELVKQTLTNGLQTYTGTNTLDRASVSVGKTATHVYDKVGFLRSSSAIGNTKVRHTGTKMFREDPGELYPKEAPPVESGGGGGVPTDNSAVPLSDIILAQTNPVSFSREKEVEVCARGTNARAQIYRDEALTEAVGQPLITDLSGRLRENVAGKPGTGYLWRLGRVDVDLVYGGDRVPLPSAGSESSDLVQADIVGALGYTPQNAATTAEVAKQALEAEPLSRDDIIAIAQGFKGQTSDRSYGAYGNQLLSSKKARGTLVPLRKGEVLTNLWTQVDVKGETLTSVFLALKKSDGTLLAKTANLSANFGATGVKGGALESPYTVPATGGYYVEILAVGTTPPSILVTTSGVTGHSPVGIGAGVVGSYSESTERSEPATQAPASLVSGVALWFAWS